MNAMTTAPVEAPAQTKRMTLSHVVELLLSRSPRDHSSVTLTRNAKGETQIEVVVRTGDDGEVLTADAALAKAIELYDTARERYPSSSPPANGAGS